MPDVLPVRLSEWLIQESKRVLEENESLSQFFRHCVLAEIEHRKNMQAWVVKKRGRPLNLSEKTQEQAITAYSNFKGAVKHAID
jgi:hypothetical protein